MRYLFISLIGLGLVLAQSEPDGAGLERGVLPERWATGGPDCASLPKWQVHQYNEDFYILRESGCTNYEKPFLFLFFGSERALLLDTGAGAGVDPAEPILKLLTGKHKLPLTVAHTHGHGDHVAGDKTFLGKEGVTLIPAKAEDTAKLVGTMDLGNRILDVIPIPGHHPLSIAVYDRRTGILLTGDSLYPGRLYVADFAQFVASTERLVEFTKDKPVANILGNHIEQTSTPYLDYPVGTKYQPEEHSLALSRAHLLELNAGLHEMNGHPVRRAFRDFTIWPK
jgi:hydroxyacylglutathione hydrolase